MLLNVLLVWNGSIIHVNISLRPSLNVWMMQKIVTMCVLAVILEARVLTLTLPITDLGDILIYFWRLLPSMGLRRHCRLLQQCSFMRKVLEVLCEKFSNLLIIPCKLEKLPSLKRNPSSS